MSLSEECMQLGSEFWHICEIKKKQRAASSSLFPETVYVRTNKTRIPSKKQTCICDINREVTMTMVMRRCWNSVQFLCPSHVVRARDCTRNSSDQQLQTRPESDHLKWEVEPAGRDAEVRVVRRDVMNAVVASRKQDVNTLQEYDRTRQAKVRVRPLVDLTYNQSDSDSDDTLVRSFVTTLNIIVARCVQVYISTKKNSQQNKMKCVFWFKSPLVISNSLRTQGADYVTNLYDVCSKKQQTQMKIIERRTTKVTEWNQKAASH